MYQKFPVMRHQTLKLYSQGAAHVNYANHTISMKIPLGLLYRRQFVKYFIK